MTYQENLDASIDVIGVDAMTRAQISEGERVLDVGCGCGHTTLELGRRVEPAGSVLGIDISTPMLDIACGRADREGLDNVIFENADAEIFGFDEARFDLVFSRAGVMFFGDPVAAFQNLGSALKPGGGLSFVCWRAPEENPRLVLPAKAAGEYVELPPRAEPGEPGPFALAEPDRVQHILSSSGFVNINLERRDGNLQLGGPGTLDDAARFALNVGPAANSIATAEASTVEKAFQAVRSMLEPHYTGTAVEMPSSAWIVTATRP